MNRSRGLILSLVLLSVPSLLMIVQRFYWLTIDALDERVAARVNNSVIERDELQTQLAFTQQMHRIHQELIDKESSFPSADPGSVLTDLIERRMISQEARVLGVDVSRAVTERLREMSTFEGGSTVDLQKRMASEGISFHLFEDYVRDFSAREALVNTFAGEQLNITEDDEKKYYQQFASDFQTPEEVHLLEILISPSAQSSDSPRTGSLSLTAKHKAERLLDAIRSGASFEQLARHESNGPTANQGGDLGWISLDTLKGYSFSFQLGAVSDVIETKQGYVILRVVGHRDAWRPRFSEVQDEVHDEIYDKLARGSIPVLLFYFRTLSFVTLKPEYSDKRAIREERSIVLLRNSIAWTLPVVLILPLSLWILARPSFSPLR